MWSFSDQFDEERLLANFLEREPERGPQRTRASVSTLHGEWLRQEALRHGVIALPARPRSDVFERILAALDAD